MENKKETPAMVVAAMNMGITSKVLDKCVPLTCKKAGEDCDYATLRGLLSASDTVGVHFWSLDQTKVDDIDAAFRRRSSRIHPDKGVVKSF